MADDDARQAALGRIKARRGFYANVVTFLILSVLLIAIWALSGRGYFWPIWAIGAYAIALAAHAWSVFGQKPISESDIEREMQRGGDAA